MTTQQQNPEQCQDDRIRSAGTVVQGSGTRIAQAFPGTPAALPCSENGSSISAAWRWRRCALPHPGCPDHNTRRHLSSFRVPSKTPPMRMCRMEENCSLQNDEKKKNQATMNHQHHYISSDKTVWNWNCKEVFYSHHLFDQKHITVCKYAHIYIYIVYLIKTMLCFAIMWGIDGLHKDNIWTIFRNFDIIT